MTLKTIIKRKMDYLFDPIAAQSSPDNVINGI